MTRLVRQQGRHVTAAGADFQHIFMLFDGNILQNTRFQLRREHAFAAAQWNFSIDEGQVFIGGRHEIFTLDHVQQLQHVEIQYVPWTDLLFDHIEAGLFDIHLWTR